MTLARRHHSLLPVVLLLLAACTVGGTGSRAGPAAIVVRITNDLVPRVSLTVWMTSAAGTRTVLGGVAPGQTETLHFRDASYAGRYLLVAQAANGREFNSTPFALAPGASVTWSVRNNTLRVSHR